MLLRLETANAFCNQWKKFVCWTSIESKKQWFYEEEIDLKTNACKLFENVTKTFLRACKAMEPPWCPPWVCLTRGWRGKLVCQTGGEHEKEPGLNRTLRLASRNVTYGKVWEWNCWTKESMAQKIKRVFIEYLFSVHHMATCIFFLKWTRIGCRNRSWQGFDPNSI